MRADDLDFDLPPKLIAQRPANRRQDARLLTFDRTTCNAGHRTISDLPSLLRAGDVLVFNDARVTPAKFSLIKPTGGRVGGLFLEESAGGRWVALLKSPGPVRPDGVWSFAAGGPPLRVVEKLGGGRYLLEVDDDRPAETVLGEVGQMPLPPYVDRPADDADAERYQTVFATTPGSVAAPTAGLHFTPDLLAALDAAGVIRTTLTLHVGIGTFRPVSADDLDEHEMHTERYSLPASCCKIINAAKAEGRRVVSVGTTTARVLESQPAGELQPCDASTNLLIQPPYVWKHVKGLLTNFHLPRSTLIALVAGLIGLEEQRRLYHEAIEQNYRFFSYGDAMLLT